VTEVSVGFRSVGAAHGGRREAMELGHWGTMRSFRPSSLWTPLMSHLTRRPLGAVLLATAAAVAVVVAALVLGARTPSPAPTRPTPRSVATGPVDARVTLGAGSPVTVPGSFLGVSTEYWTIPVWARQLGLLRRVLAMLSQGGPIRLRIGGDSADRVQWAPTKELPEWVFELSGSWLRKTSQIVSQTGVKLILDLNLVTSTPALAARWAQIAVRNLPPGSITAFEIGNEPDIYSQRAWQQITAGPGVPPLPSQITATSYARSFASYANALAKVAPGVPLLAPALAEPQTNSGWVTKLLQAPHPGLAGITAHRYPYSACAKRRARTFPTIARVLSENATVGIGRTAQTLEHITDRARLPLWLTEINSVTCGGTMGVSNTFATALWAPDALFELVRAGVESTSVHVRADAINMAFSLTRTGLVAYPLFYGMVLFTKMLGPGAQLIPLHLAAPAALHLKAWAVRLSNGMMHILLIDKGDRPARVRLQLPFTGTATVERLTAPKVAATGHVTFGAQHLTHHATWAGTPRAETIAPTPNGYRISVARYSAALVTARLRAGS
jgi:hypothetical protein